MPARDAETSCHGLEPTNAWCFERSRYRFYCIITLGSHGGCNAVTPMSIQLLSIPGADNELLNKLADFFNSLRQEGDEVFFHPHPLTHDQVMKLVHYAGDDEYYALVDERRVLAYGMLRGWDEGFEIPSLGVAVAPSERGCGIAPLMMQFLQLVAKRRNADSVRLTVHPENTRAIRLFRRSGYEFQQSPDGRIVGYLKL